MHIKFTRRRTIVSISKRKKVDFYQGSPEDVLLRLYEAKKKYKAKYVINITADCPLVVRIT